MSLLINIAHMILAATLSFLGLGYERDDEARAVQLVPQKIEIFSGGALLTSASFSMPAQNAQSSCAPSLVTAPPQGGSGAVRTHAVPQIVIVNDCETLSLRRALPAL